MLDTLGGAALLAGLVWLSVDTSEGALRVDLDGGGLVALFALVLLVIAPATFLAAIAPRRPPAEPPAGPHPA